MKIDHTLSPFTDGVSNLAHPPPSNSNPPNHPDLSPSHSFHQPHQVTSAVSAASKKISSLMDILHSPNQISNQHPTTHSDPSSPQVSSPISKKHTPSTSGKHTPTTKKATGDFREFLEASELQAALEKESKKAQTKLEKERKRESAKGKFLNAFKHDKDKGKEKEKGKSRASKVGAARSSSGGAGSRRHSSDTHGMVFADDEGEMNEEIEEDERRRRSLEERKSKSSSNETQEKHFPGDIFFAEKVQNRESTSSRPRSRPKSASEINKSSSADNFQRSRPSLNVNASSSSSGRGSSSHQLPSGNSSSSITNRTDYSISSSPPTSPPSKIHRGSSGRDSSLLPPALCGAVSESDETTDEEADRIPGDDSEAERAAEREAMEEQQRSQVQLKDGKVKPFSKSLGGSWGRAAKDRRPSNSSSLKKEGILLKGDTTVDTSATDSDTDSEEAASRYSRELSRSRSATITNGLSDSQLTEKGRPLNSQFSNALGKKDLASSTLSLKSYGTEKEGDNASIMSGTSSFHSGGANVTLSRPLLELEELELESFLKNFGRHTREVRVPASANFPRRRMPQWSDFKIPANEAALAAAEGKKVTVLSHVDRGLQALLESEGAGGAQPRHLPLPTGEDSHQKKEKTDKKKRDKRDKSKKVDPDVTPAGSSAEDGGESHETGTPMKVKWDPSTGFQSSATKSTAFAASDSNNSLTSHSQSKHSFLGLRKRTGSTDLERSEKEAKTEARKLFDEASKSLSDGRFSSQEVAKATEDSGLPDSVPKNQQSEGYPRDRPEYRPSGKEKRESANDADWTLIEAGEHGSRAQEIEVDSSIDEKVDGVAFCIAYILALVERYAPEQLDDAPDQSFRESKARSHLERVYLIAPFWENFLFGLRRLYRWEDSRRTALFFMGYFVLWYTDLIPTAFLFYIMFNICRYRFFPPDASVLHEAVRRRMSRGVEADRLAEKLRRRSRLDVYQIYNRFTQKYGADLQGILGDVADAHEMIKNLILWRNPTGTWRTLGLFAVVTTFVTLAPAHYVWKAFFFFIGFTFFCLMPLQSHYPRYRRPLSPIWWVLWGSPTDAQFAVQLLRRRHLESANGGSGGSLKRRKGDAKPSSAAHAVANGGLDNDVYQDTGNFSQVPGKAYTTGSGREVTKPAKLGSFYCLHHGVPGHLHVTSERLYFVGIHAAAVGTKGKTHKVAKTLLGDVAGLVKTKSMNLIFYRSAGLQVVRKDGSSIFFSNLSHRDDAFNLLLAVGSETHVWTKV